MRALTATVALAVGVSVYAPLPAVADEKADQKGTGVLAKRMQDLNLTDEQEAKIADIRKQYKPKVQEAAERGFRRLCGNAPAGGHSRRLAFRVARITELRVL